MASENTIVINPIPIDIENISLSPITINGEVMGELPQDLYIPPEALQVYLDSFAGPLDLLLYLIRRAKFDILNIPMAALTLQYLEYVEVMRKKNLNLAAEYLAMAAILIDIKCKMLLPKPTLDILQEGEEDEGDPRAQLVKRLLQYEQIQKAALHLDELPLAGRDFFWGYCKTDFNETLLEPELRINDLVLVWQEILTRIKHRRHHQVSAEPLSLREQMTYILKRLKESDGKYFDFFSLLPEITISHAVIGFIAILELAKQQIIELNQTEILNNESINTSPLYIKLCGVSESTN